MKKQEILARAFHNIYEELAPQFGYETRTETRQFDPTTPNGRLMIAVCERIIDDIQESITSMMNDRYREIQQIDESDNPDDLIADMTEIELLEHEIELLESIDLLAEFDEDIQE